MAEPDPITDPARLAAVRALGLVDAPQQELLARLNRLAQQLLGVPVSIVSILDADRQVHAAQLGLFEDEHGHSELPLSHSFCANIVRTGQALVVEDARVHPLVRENPSIETYGVVAYAGLPLRLADGEIAGAFCAIDSSPRQWTDAELQVLRDLTDLATALLNARRDEPVG